MKLLDFTKPTKKRPADEHNDTFVADGAVPGAYVPNMSEADAERWKAKHVNAGKPGERIELRKTMGGSQVLIIVAPNGWDYKNDTRVPDRWGRSTEGLNVRMSMNGPVGLTFAEFAEIDQIVNEAREVLDGR